MATIPQKNADLGTLIDDLAGLLDANPKWSDADTDIVNANDQILHDASDPDGYMRNGRVYTHEDTGTYLLFYLHNHMYRADTIENTRGIRFLHSTDWNETDHIPAGKTNLTERETVDLNRHDGALGREKSFEWISAHNRRGHGLHITEDRDNPPMEDIHETECTYFMSVGDDYITIAAWITYDGTNGYAAYYSWEYANEKFWDDGEVPVVQITQDESDNGRGTNFSYGYKDHRDFNGTYNIIGTNGCLEGGRWGTINPDGVDDTFFLRPATVYASPNREVPVTYVKNVLPNHRADGAAHGDIVQHDGMEFICMRQAGAAGNNNVPVTALLRHE